jgi:uncharacterized membrane protein affecting hemolysin expression
MDLNELDAKYRDKFEAVQIGVFVAILIALLSFTLGFFSAIVQSERLDRLERIEGIDSIGRKL